MKDLKVGNSFLYRDELWIVDRVYENEYAVWSDSDVPISNYWFKLSLHEYLQGQVKKPQKHTHILKLYEGFTDTYKYCTECNHKEKT